MAIIQTVRGFTPQIGKACFLAQTSAIIGQVISGDQCSLWFNTVVRGDVNSISIGRKTNIQDGAIIHCTYKKYSTTIGNMVSIGHGAIIHGCEIEDNVLIGMGATVLDQAIIKTGCVIAAGAVVLSGTVTEPDYIYAGIPAKKVKMVGEELKKTVLETPDRYVKYARWYTDS